MSPVLPPSGGVPTSVAAPATRPASRIRRFFRRVSRGIILTLALGMLLQIVLVTTPLTDKLYFGLVVSSEPVPADVIVVLGGRHERLIWAATAFHRKLAPRVIVSNAPGAAQEMKKLLVNCGVPEKSILLDTKSHTTAEHPAGVASVPGIDPVHQRFLIVTDHEHSRRVAACFRKAGYQHFTIYGGPLPLRDEETGSHWKWRILFLPRIAYEYAALVQYWAQGKI